MSADPFDNAQTVAVVTALIDEVEGGDDPLLPDWPRDAFGAIDAN